MIDRPPTIARVLGPLLVYAVAVSIVLPFVRVLSAAPQRHEWGGAARALKAWFNGEERKLGRWPRPLKPRSVP